MLEDADDMIRGLESGKYEFTKFDPKTNVVRLQNTRTNETRFLTPSHVAAHINHYGAKKAFGVIAEKTMLGVFNPLSDAAIKIANPKVSDAQGMARVANTRACLSM